MNLYYLKSYFLVDNSLAIEAYTVDPDEPELGPMPYGPVNTCLAGYGITPEDDRTIFLPKYKMTEEFYETIINDLVDKVICPIRIGYGIGEKVRLKEDWESHVNMLERLW